MTDNEMSMQDKTMQGFNNALENLPLLISVLKGKTSLLLRHKPTSIHLSAKCLLLLQGVKDTFIKS